MIPPVGSISAALQAGQLGAASPGASTLSQNVSALAQGTSAITPGAESAVAATPSGEGALATTPSGEGGFGEALSSAISSLEQTQQSATGAAQSLATGTATDPESAVVSIDEAQLAMQLASQIRTKATEAAQQIFQTQV